MFKVGVIGLGHIAASYETPDSLMPYCHVGGIRFSDQVKLQAVADVSDLARESFRSVWGSVFPEVHTYSSSSEMLSTEALDIVSVCVRGPYHYEVMQEVIAARPRSIFLEKPPTCSLSEMDHLVALAAAANVPITVSYSRHWAPHVLRLQELVEEGIIGEVKTVVGYTGHAVLSFASHTTDLICQFAGYHPEAVYALGTVMGVAPEGYEPEPSLDSMTIDFRHSVTGIQIGGQGEHGGFYCDVFGTKGSLRAGIYTPPVIRNAKGKILDIEECGMPPDASVFTVAYNQIAAYLEGGPLPDCTNESFITVNEIGFAAIESIHTNRRVEVPNQNRSRRVFANG